MTVLFQHSEVSQSPCKKEVFERNEKALLFAYSPLNNGRERLFSPILHATAGKNEKIYIRNTPKNVKSRQSAKNFKVGRVSWRNSTLQNKTPKIWHAEISLLLLVFSRLLQFLPFVRPAFVHRHSSLYFQMTQYQIFLPQVTTWNLGRTSSDADLELPNPVTFNSLLNPVSSIVLSTRNRNYTYKEWFMNCGRICRKWCSGYLYSKISY